MDRREEGSITNKRVRLSFFLLLITEVILLFHLLICLFVSLCECVCVLFMLRWDLRLFTIEKQKDELDYRLVER